MKLKRSLTALLQAGGEAIAVTTDVTDPDALEALAVATKAAFGKLTIWVNNAGGSTMRQPMTTLPRGRVASHHRR